MRLDDIVSVTCTDTDKTEQGKVVRLGRDRADIMVGPAVISFHMKKPGIYVGNLHGLEFVMKTG
ncbi:hypothetical protein NUH88_18315 [Nisaea acidiphila]|uniref:Uncharacterized protein n=1 Tax=Nisaea acidiphila TaxID=1862145 RepID=A0A9J7AVA2_9PROT|nr:hypothetical protein [Nisaea acidiphila]UUX49341.1 hypothetical protein NUH88_18315 [Nisaea acidiphila]